MSTGTPPIDNLEIQISSQSTTAASGINKLANSLKNLKSQLETKALQDLINKLSKLSDALNNINTENLSKLQTISSSVNTSNLDRVREKVDGLTQSMEQLAGAAKKAEVFKVPDVSKSKNNVLQPETANANKDFDYKNVTKITSSIGQAIPALSSLTSSFSSTAEGASGLVSSLSEVSGTAGAAASASSGLAAAAGPVGIAIAAATIAIKIKIKVLKTLISVLKKVIKVIYNFTLGKIVDQIKKVTSAIQGLIKSFARIALYRLIRSAIRSITDAFKEGTENVYFYSKAIGSDLSIAFDKMSSATLKMKNQIGSAAAELVTALMPVILKAIGLITTLANVMSQVFAVFRGKGTYSKAVDVTKSYADAATDAGKAAKDLKGQLLGFDELNVLNTNQSSGGSAGSGGIAYEDMFEEKEVDDWIKEIKNSIDRGDWYGAGELLANHINEMINNWDAKGWGENLGSKMQGAVELALGFLRDADFQGAGVKLADAINGIAHKFSGEDFGKVLGAALNDIVDFIYGFFANLDIVAVAEDIVGVINGFFEEVDWEKIRSTFEIAFAKIFVGVTKIVKEAKIGEKIKQIFSALPWKTIILPVGVLIGSYLVQGILFVFNPILGLLTAPLFKGSRKVLKDALDQNMNDIIQNAEATTGEYSNIMNEGFSDLSKDLEAQNIALTTNISNDWDSTSKNVGGSINKTSSTFKNTWSSISSWFTSKWEKAKLFLEKIPTFFHNIMAKIKSFFKFDWIKIPHFTWTSTQATGWVTSVLKALNLPAALPKLNVKWYAEGGFPTMGELFVANEQGAEMVGRIGNRTAVANNDQIVTAIYNAVLNAMSESNRNNNNNEAYGDIYIDGTKAGKIVAKSVGNELYRTGFQLRST